MNTFEYYRESICCALDECDAYTKLTKEEIDAIAHAVEGSAENFSTAFGYDCISNPLETEIDRLKANHAQELRTREREYDLAFKAACRAARVDPENYYLNREGYLERLR